MNDIVAAVSSQTSAAINGSAAQGGESSAPADGLFALLVNELTGQEAPGPAGAKPGKQDDATNMPALIAALMQYGNLMGLLPFTTDTAAQQAGTNAGTAAQAAAPTAQRASGRAGLMSLMAARLLANTDKTAQAAQNTAQAAPSAQAGEETSQEAQEFLNLLQALEGAPATGTAQVQTDGQPAGALQSAPNGLEALQQIKQLFIDLIEASQQADTTQQTDVTAEAASPAQAKQARHPLPSRAMNIASALLSALEGEAPLPAADATQTATKDFTPSAEQGNAGNDMQLHAGAGDTGAAHKAEAADKKNATGFDAALRAYHAPSQHAQATGLPEGNTASAHARLSPAEAFDAIVDKIKAAGSAGQKEMEISLKPEFLGKVVIKLTMDEGGLVAKIAASNPKVQDAFASQAASLQSTLAEQGLKDVRVVVTSTAVPDTALQQQASNGGQARREQEKKHNPVVVQGVSGSPAASQPLLAYEQAYRTGSVNCLA